MKRYFVTPLLGFFLTLPLMTFANNPHQADTIGMKVSRTYRTIQTTVIVEQSMDSIVSLDSLGNPNKITFVTYDTLQGQDATETIDTTYFITQPLIFWRFGTTNEATTTMLFRTYWERGSANSYALFLRNRSFANYSRGLSSWRNELDW